MVILAGAIVACVTSGAWADSVKSGPIRLTEAQMDSVTAGKLELSVVALANALGQNTITDTSTRVNVFKRGIVEFGFGVGEAFACCGADSDTAVLTEGSADGRIVSTREHIFTKNTPQFSYTIGTIFVVSIKERPVYPRYYPSNIFYDEIIDYR